MDKFLLVAPKGRRRLWQVRGYAKNRWVGTWRCDSEEIAKLVALRLRKGQAPGWAAHDLRHGKASIA